MFKVNAPESCGFKRDLYLSDGGRIEGGTKIYEDAKNEVDKTGNIRGINIFT